MNRWTGKTSGLEEWLELLKHDQDIMDNITHWRTIPPREASTAALPADLHPKLAEALRTKGIDELYTHQETAYRFVREGHSIVAVTPTASGKTLCYNLRCSSHYWKMTKVERFIYFRRRRWRRIRWPSFRRLPI